ncbi:MAG: hypothetical protein JWL72_2875 [Ilumatobacteraceae bacterium]|nr:hypothetical protein [Ilumatobacteraceae bacterium]MCU1389537.1 hypothetical protein [Ilumatobacteraceae bacterium]
MTALPSRRRNRTIAAALSGLLVLGAAPALGYVGWDVLRNSKEGTEAKTYPYVAFPSTPTAMIATVDDQQVVTALAVLVLAPGTGKGGTIVSFPTDASSSQTAEEQQVPMAQSVIVGGEEGVVSDTESLARVSIGNDGVLDQTSLAALLAPLGSIKVTLPNDVVAADAAGSTKALFVAGAADLTPEQAASVLIARDPNQAEAKRLPNVHTMWSAIATAIGAGIKPDAVTPLGTSGPATFAEFMQHFMAGPVQVFNDLSTTPITGSTNPDKIDVGRIDISSVVTLMANLAPSAMITPNSTLSFRIENGLTQADIDAAGLKGVTPIQVTLDIVQRVLFAQGNIVSVSPEVFTLASKKVPDTTTVFSAGGLQSAELQVFTDTFGKVTFKDPPFQFPLVNIVLVVGRSYLDGMLARATSNATSTTTAATGTGATGTVADTSASTVSS